MEECFPESNAALCLRSGRRCGEHTLIDRCQEMRTIVCGVCEDSLECSASFQCDSENLTDEQFCQINGAECGSRLRDGQMVDCGSCETPETCGGSGLPNVCGCTPESDGDFCNRQMKQCGSVDGTDNCGNPRTATCGNCTGTGERCQDNICVCTPSSKEDFCQQKGATCGSVTGTDNCGAVREENCGACTDGKTCQADNTCAGMVCTESEQEFCNRYGKNCGTFTNVSCGTSRTVNCGMGCNSGESCTNNVCACTPLTQCGLNQNCGDISNGCGGTISCGSCNGTCTNNNCACNSPTDSELCSLNLRACGLLQITDRCGVYRTVDCGACTNGDCFDGTCGFVVDLCTNKVCLAPNIYCVEGACCQTMIPCQ